jgi:hypothetical protein
VRAARRAHRQRYAHITLSRAFRIAIEDEVRLHVIFSTVLLFVRVWFVEFKV